MQQTVLSGSLGRIQQRDQKHQKQSGLIADSLQELREGRESEWRQIRQQRRMEERDASFKRRLRAFELEFGSVDDLIGDPTLFADL